LNSVSVFLVTNFTVNGNSAGAPCAPSWIYNGNSYSSCTTVNYTKPWCSTTSNYDNDRKFGECLDYGKILGLLGTSGRVSCQTKLQLPTSWRALNKFQGGVGDIDSEWDMFHASNAEAAYQSCGLNPRNHWWTSAVKDAVRVKKESYLDFLAFNGNSAGAPCAPSWIYNGNSHSSCTTVNYTKPWCSTTSNYDNDRKWGECLDYVTNFTVNGNSAGAPCAPSWIYNGNSYSSCTTVNYTKPWCSTTSNYDNDRKWGECLDYDFLDFGLLKSNSRKNVTYHVNVFFSCVCK
uniref:Fibronectin type-II domain-containing protein n=1 Tax=Astyanax mexicanus TaxID=7994 RepID=A0A3B1KII3_ASTMX